MTEYQSVAIVNTGIALPVQSVRNESKLLQDRIFYDPTGERVKYTKGENRGEIKPTSAIINTLEEITTIRERRFSKPGETTFDYVVGSAQDCLENSGTNPNSLKVFGVAHNFGEVGQIGATHDLVPPRASRAKHGMGITDTNVIAYDIIATREDAEEILSHVAGGEGHLILGDGVDSMNEQDVGAQARRELESGKYDPNNLSSIVVVHDPNVVESVSRKAAERLGIRKGVLTYDLLGGCPGLLQMIIQSKDVLDPEEKALYTGAELLYKVSDDSDMSSLIFSCGAGTMEVRGIKSDKPTGLLGSHSITDAEKAYLLWMGEAFDKDKRDGRKNPFLHMDGPSLYRLVMKAGPDVTIKALENAGVSLRDIDMFLYHQANGKMDADTLAYTLRALGAETKKVKLEGDKIMVSDYGLKKYFNPGLVAKLHEDFGDKEFYDADEIASVSMPMTIAQIGNNSVATLPILWHMIFSGRFSNFNVKKGTRINLKSMGAGTNINDVIYETTGLERFAIAT